MKSARIASALGKATRTKHGWKCLCPAHDDSRPSLSVADGRKGLLVFCHAGCSQQDVISALKLRSLWPEAAKRRSNGLARPSGPILPPSPPPVEARSGKRSKERGTIETIYDYTDGDGELKYQVVRFRDPKDFRQRRPDGEGGWVWNMQGIEAIPYRLPEFPDGEGGLMLIVEGEKDADALAKLGYCATTSHGGAGKWPDSVRFNRHFRGLDCVIVPDKDPPGRKHAAQVAAAIGPIAQSVRVLDLPGISKDASDWIKLGGNAKTLEQLVEWSAPLPEWASDTKPAKLVSAQVLRSEKIDWLIHDWLPRGMLTLLGGAVVLGKTALSIDLAAKVSRGATWWTEETGPPRDVMVWSDEDDAARILKPRLVAAGARMDGVYFVQGVEGRMGPFDAATDMPSLVRSLRQHPDTALLILDPISRVASGKNDVYSAQAVREALAPVQHLASEFNIAVLGITHFLKRAKQNTVSVNDRFIGSQAWIAVSRSAWMVDYKGEERVLGRTKGNVAGDMKGCWTYSLDSETVRTDDGADISVPLVRWGERVEETAEQLFKAEDEAGGAGGEFGVSVDTAKEFLRTEFESLAEITWQDMEERGAKSEGISRRSLRRARDSLRSDGAIRKRRDGRSGKWYWSSTSPRSPWSG